MNTKGVFHVAVLAVLCMLFLFTSVVASDVITEMKNLDPLGKGENTPYDFALSAEKPIEEAFRTFESTGKVKELVEKSVNLEELANGLTPDQKQEVVKAFEEDKTNPRFEEFMAQSLGTSDFSVGDDFSGDIEYTEDYKGKGEGVVLSPNGIGDVNGGEIFIPKSEASKAASIDVQKNKVSVSLTNKGSFELLSGQQLDSIGGENGNIARVTGDGTFGGSFEFDISESGDISGKLSQDGKIATYEFTDAKSKMSFKDPKGALISEYGQSVGDIGAQRPRSGKSSISVVDTKGSAVMTNTYVTGTAGGKAYEAGGKGSNFYVGSDITSSYAKGADGAVIVTKDGATGYNFKRGTPGRSQCGGPGGCKWIDGTPGTTPVYFKSSGEATYSLPGVSSVTSQQSPGGVFFRADGVQTHRFTPGNAATGIDPFNAPRVASGSGCPNGLCGTCGSGGCGGGCAGGNCGGGAAGGAGGQGEGGSKMQQVMQAVMESMKGLQGLGGQKQDSGTDSGPSFSSDGSTPGSLNTNPAGELCSVSEEGFSNCPPGGCHLCGEVFDSELQNIPDTSTEEIEQTEVVA